MKLSAILVAASLAFAGASMDAEESEHRFLFAKWRAQHGKAYDAAQVDYRFNVFRENARFVKNHMLEYEAGLHTHTVSLNEFADMTNKEFGALYKGYRKENVGGMRGADATFDHDGSDLPTSVDWRTKGVVAPVENQGQCGSCWSFSASGSMTGANALKTGKIVQVAEQQFVDCVAGGADTCSVGGQMTQAFEFAIAKGGVEPESDYPYCACSGNQCNWQKSEATITTITGYQNVTQGSEQAALAAVAQYPTVSIAVNAGGMNWQFYSGGVMSGSCPGSPDDLDHGVLLVGYDANSVIVKNSWGAGWGEQGYVQLPRGVAGGYCGFAQDASFPTTD